MRIVMLTTSRGSDDPRGRFVKTYHRGETYDMETDWQIAVAQAFISTGRANEVQADDRVAALETKESTVGPRIVKPNDPFFEIRSYAKELAGYMPKDKPEVLAILREHGVLDETG